ncbi:MAG TPA: hypothetical protein VFB38_25375 [Chthonomonadaceae bacterium]|nr:hypothetical protein [Chthonomonadaceae bacterium]
MRRLTLLVLVFLFAASANFGEAGTWRCANGTPCVFTPGIGFHCPGASPARHPRVAAPGPASRSCCAAHGARALAAASRSCGVDCLACQCRFEVTSLRAPAITAQASGIAVSVVAEQPILFAAAPAPTAGFVVGPVIFTTGPPAALRSHPFLPTPSRAPPRLLAA